MSPFAFALQDIDTARLFRLEADGRTSYLLATAYENFPADRRMPPVDQALRNSCAVWLEGDVVRPEVADTPAFGRHLIELLTLEQMQTYLTVVGFHVPHHSLTPGHATVLVRDQFSAARSSAFAEFIRYLTTLDDSEQRTLLHYAAVTPQLRDAVRILFGNELPAQYLINRMKTLDDSDPLEEIQFMPDLIEAEARRNNLPIHRLEAPPGASVTDFKLSAFALANLRITLDQIRPILAPANGYSLYTNMGLAYLISWELSQRYFRQSAAEYGRVHDLLAKSLLGPRAHFNGDNLIATYAANLHNLWVDQLVHAVREGGAFIALPIGRVIPGADRRVKRSLIHELRARGIAVTPLSAERATLRAVK